MRSMLKALGATIWGLIAIGLLTIFMFVGYEAAIRYRASSGRLPDESATNNLSAPGQLGPSDATAVANPTGRINDSTRASVPSHNSDATRKLLLDDVHSSEYQSAIALGQQLADANSAGPRDLLIVAQSYASIGDCEKARLWAKKAQAAFKAAGVVPDGSLRSVISCCGPERKNYEVAIASIERGLKKGGVAHLDEAYVYLGLSKQAIGDMDGARNAFGKLKDVPGISSRVLRLWTLYAETQLTNSENWHCPNATS